jgi:peptidoglycan/LPS O-acetylase OafA/YrhL
VKYSLAGSRDLRHLPTALQSFCAAMWNSNAPSLVSGESHEVALDGLRGLAALVVLYHHLVISSVGRWSLPRWLAWPVEASAAVMIFFVLSGYVIGLTNSKVAAPGATRDYLWRRLVRLVPINTMAVLLACAAATSWDLTTAVTHLLFLESYADYAGVWVPVIYTNGNLWSLNHEVVYYGLFALLWFWRGRVLTAAIIAIAVLLLGWYTKAMPVILACYAAGFLFWLSGLALAWHAPHADSEKTAWPSALLLALITWKLELVEQLVSGFRMPLFAGPTVKLYYLDFLPVAVWLVAAGARRTFPGFRWIKLAAFTIPAAGLAWHRSHPGAFAADELVAAFWAYLVAVLLAKWRPSLRVFRFAAPVGTISFALYAFARPIQYLVFERMPLPTGAAGFIGATLCVLILSVGLAWFFERRVQPAIRRLLTTKKDGKVQNHRSAVVAASSN